MNHLYNFDIHIDNLDGYHIMQIHILRFLYNSDIEMDNLFDLFSNPKEYKNKFYPKPSSNKLWFQGLKRWGKQFSYLEYDLRENQHKKNKGEL